MYAADLIYFYHMGLLWYSNFMEFNESASTITTIDVYYWFKVIEQVNHKELELESTNDFSMFAYFVMFFSCFFFDVDNELSITYLIGPSSNNL